MLWTRTFQWMHTTVAAVGVACSLQGAFHRRFRNGLQLLIVAWESLSPWLKLKTKGCQSFWEKALLNVRLMFADKVPGQSRLSKHIGQAQLWTLYREASDRTWAGRRDRTLPSYNFHLKKCVFWQETQEYLCWCLKMLEAHEKPLLLRWLRECMSQNNQIHGPMGSSSQELPRRIKITQSPIHRPLLGPEGVLVMYLVGAGIWKAFWALFVSPIGKPPLFGTTNFS